MQTAPKAFRRYRQCRNSADYTARCAAAWCDIAPRLHRLSGRGARCDRRPCIHIPPAGYSRDPNLRRKLDLRREPDWRRAGWRADKPIETGRASSVLLVYKDDTLMKYGAWAIIASSGLQCCDSMDTHSMHLLLCAVTRKEDNRTIQAMLK